MNDTVLTKGAGRPTEYKLADGSIVQRIHEAVRFVPLESGVGDG